MSALAEEEEDADTPARDHWSLLSQGAEARVYGLDLCGLPAVAKHRHRKAYRIAALDGRSGFRTVAEWVAHASAGHWGHTHRRKIRFRALMELAEIDGAWKLAGLTVVDARQEN